MAEEQKHGKPPAERLMSIGRLNLAVSAVLLVAVLALPVVVGRFADKAADAPLLNLAVGEMAALTLEHQGEMVPNIVFQDAGGADLTFEAFRGQVVLINLWATWCAPCVAEMPSLAALQTEMGGEAFQVVAVSMDREGPDVAGPFLKKVGGESLELYTEANMLMTFGFKETGLPLSVLVDRGGREIARLRGPADWASPEAKALIAHLIDPDAEPNPQ